MKHTRPRQDGEPTGRPGPRKERRVGAGVSLEQFAAAKSTSYDKRKVVAKEKERLMRKTMKLKKLKHKLEAEGKLPATLQARDNGAPR
jgi:hypothetical protein